MTRTMRLRVPGMPFSWFMVLLAFLACLSGCNQKSTADVDAERDRKFQETMSGVTLVGYSTRLNREGLSGEERYIIDKVTKVGGETWLFQARMKYGGRELPVPVPITVKWAGDTPVITLTDLSIPGAGTYTARVLIYRDQYAGTWSGGDHGGQMFGKVLRIQ